MGVYYGVYGSCSTLDNLNKLQLFQNCVCRTILLADHDTHIIGMHNALNLLYLSQRRDLHLCVSCHKSIHLNGFSSLSNFYIPVLNVTDRNTRYADATRTQVPRTRTKIAEQVISVRGPKLWNSLPSDLRWIDDVIAFKRELSSRIQLLFVNHPT